MTADGFRRFGDAAHPKVMSWKGVHRPINTLG